MELIDRLWVIVVFMVIIVLISAPLMAIYSQKYQEHTGIIETKHEAIVPYGFSSATEYNFMINVSGSMILYEVDQIDYLQYDVGDEYQFRIGSYADKEKWDILNPEVKRSN